MPPDALHNAITIAITSVTETPVWLELTIEFSWNTRNRCTSMGSAAATSCTCFSTVLGSATRP